MCHRYANPERGDDHADAGTGQRDDTVQPALIRRQTLDHIHQVSGMPLHVLFELTKPKGMYSRFSCTHNSMGF